MTPPTSSEPHPLDLDAVKTPVFEIIFRGQKHTFEPFQLADKLQAEMKLLVKDSDPPSSTTFEKIRLAVGLSDLSSTQCFAVLGALHDFIKALPEVKKLSDLTQNSSASTRA
jgi:hypothetical protein